MGEETGDRRMGRRLTVQGWFHVVLALMVLMVVGGSVVGARLLEETSDAPTGWPTACSRLRRRRTDCRRG